MQPSARPHPESRPDPVIIPPRPGPRAGALRVVRIEPPVIPAESPAEAGVAVQGLLPLDDLSVPQVPVGGRGRQGARRAHPTVHATDAELRHVAQQFCVGVTEVIFGDRAVSQLVRCTSERVYVDLAKRSAMSKSRRRMTQERVAPARLARIRLQRPSARAVEISARLRQGERNHALAARLELIHGRWICVALEAAAP